MKQDTEQDLAIIQFEDRFSIEFLTNKLRDKQMYGGIVEHMIPGKNGVYLIPEQIRRELEPYYMELYKNAGVIIDTQETYTYDNKYVYVHGEALVTDDGVSEYSIDG